MSASTLLKADFETAKTSSYTGVGAAFAPLGTPLAFPAQSIIITSTLKHGGGGGGGGSGQDRCCWISTNSSENKILVPGNCVLVIDVSDKLATGKISFPKGTQFYVKQGPDGAPSSGNISITTVYTR
jgi:hypothetical protein